MWKITKEFYFEYGHRVWNQDLVEEFSGCSINSCRFLHGHSGKILVTLQGEELKNGMVFDFKNLDFIKKFIDESLDHKFIMDINDPLSNMMGLKLNGERYYVNKEGYKIINLDNWYYQSSPIEQKEYFSSFILVDFVPTSENICKWLYDIIQNRLKDAGIKVYSIKFFETVKSSSEYIG